MRSKHIIVLALLLAFTLGGFAVASALDIGEYREENSTEVKQVRHVIETLDEKTVSTGVSKIEAMNVAESSGYVLGDSKVSLIQDSGVDRTYWEIVADKKLFKIDAGSGEMLAISDNNEYEPELSVVDSDNAIEVARGKLLTINESIPCINEPTLELKESRWGTLYRVFWQQDKNGIPIENGYMSVELDTSGRIRHFRKFWQDLEVDTAAKVTKEEAIKIAQEKALVMELPALLRERIGKATNVYTSLMIEKPFNPLDKTKPILGEYCLVWEVGFESGAERSYENVEFAIDAHSGELVGINYTK